MDHQLYINRCLQLAAPHISKVSPNPLVGAVLVLNDRIIGEGAHLNFGGSHAEVNAINSVSNKSLIQGSTLYVNLEPCNHHGKTPPCTEYIIKHNIKHVVISTKDPNKKVSGKGIEELNKNGIQVTSGILENEAVELNKRFFCFHTQNRPYIILKWAQTTDGFLADEFGKSKWISNAISRMLVHKWRSEETAIIVGTNTVLIDDPSLNVRDWYGKDPIKIVIDKSLKLNFKLKIFNENNRLIIFNEKTEKSVNHIQYFKIDFNSKVCEQILNRLYQLNILSVIVEGGAVLLNSFINSGYWDEARVFTGTDLFKEGLKAPDFHYTVKDTIKLGGDILKIYRNG